MVSPSLGEVVAFSSWLFLGLIDELFKGWLKFLMKANSGFSNYFYRFIEVLEISQRKALSFVIDVSLPLFSLRHP